MCLTSLWTILEEMCKFRSSSEYSDFFTSIYYAFVVCSYGFISFRREINNLSSFLIYNKFIIVKYMFCFNSYLKYEYMEINKTYAS